jgi:hypothetical protein
VGVAVKVQIADSVRAQCREKLQVTAVPKDIRAFRANRVLSYTILPNTKPLGLEEVKRAFKPFHRHIARTISLAIKSS